MKNPWMSLWLSAANAWAGAARGFWSAEMQRQQQAFMNEWMRQATQFWTGGFAAPPSTRRRSRNG
jgi:hypothetical protein